MSDLMKQIDDLVASKTFNLDALDAIKALKDNLKETLEERKNLEKRYDGLYEVNARQSDELLSLNKRLEDVKNQLELARKTAEEGRKAIYEAEKHKAVAEAWQGAMAMVFKPNTVRETVFQSMPIAHNYNGSTSVVPYQQETKTTREEV